MKQISKTKLLTVEATFFIEGRGVIVTPNVPVDSYDGPRSLKVILRRPDGQENTASVSLGIPFVTPKPRKLYYLCILSDVTKDDIPIGTEIWICDDCTV